MFVELDENNFEKETQEGLKLVDFYTTWCKYCQNQQAILEELSNNGFYIGKLDCDKYSKIAHNFNVTGFPTIILFKNGKNIEQMVGLHSKSQILDKLTKHL